MKLASRAVEPFLEKPDRVYRAALIYGPDTGLVRERAGRVKKAVLGDKVDALAITELSEATLLDDPARLADEMMAVGFLTPKRIVIVNCSSDKPAKLIQEAAAHFHESVFLLVLAEELGTRSALRAWCEAEPLCAVVACYRDEIGNIHDMIRQSLAKAGISVDGDVAEYLASQLGNDRYVTRQEIEKIITFAGDTKTVSLAQARLLVDYSGDTGLDDVVFAVADRNLAELERALGVLLHEGTTPVAYLRALQRYFNRLYYIQSRIASGQSAESVIAGLKPKVYFKHVPLMHRHLQSWNLENLVKALKLLIAAELAIKTSDLPPIPASSRRLLQVTQVR